MSAHIRRGACPTTSKRIYITRAEAKKDMRRGHMKDVTVYKCDGCGQFHVGGWHGEKDRSVHRGETEPDTMPLSEACRVLDVSAAFIQRLVVVGKIRTYAGELCRVDVERIISI